jgi:hypothetical protein
MAGAKDMTTTPASKLTCDEGCTNTFTTRGGYEKHMKNKHDNTHTGRSKEIAYDDDEVEEESEDKWLYNALDRRGEVYDIPGKEDEAKALNKKVERIKKVVKAKADIIVDMWKKNKNIEEKVTSLEASEAKLVEKVDALEASGSNCRECILTKEVIRNKDALINKKEKETKAEEKKKVDMKRQFDNQSKVVKDMKINYEKAVEENNELRNKFDEQTDIIKNLQEQCGIDDDEDDVEEVPVQKNLMDKNKSGHLCLTCNFRFTSNNGLEQHIQEKHTELSCNYCEKSFKTKKRGQQPL